MVRQKLEQKLKTINEQSLYCQGAFEIWTNGVDLFAADVEDNVCCYVLLIRV